MLDTDATGIEILSPMAHLAISGIYGTAGTVRKRPFILVNGDAHVHIANWYSHSSSAFPDILVNSPAAEVTLSGFNTIHYATDTPWAVVQQGVLRLVLGFLYLAGASRTVAAIQETSSGSLIIDDLTINGSANSGPLVSVVSSGVLTMIGRLNLVAGNSWTLSLPAGLTTTHYAPSEVFTGAITTRGPLHAAGGLSFGTSVVSGTDLSKHISLYDGFNGLNVDANGINVVVSNAMAMNISSTFMRVIGAILAPALSGSPSYANDAAAATGGVGVTQLYRNGSVVQVRVA
jgi:hypothetical protein